MSFFGSDFPPSGGPFGASWAPLLGAWEPFLFRKTSQAKTSYFTRFPFSLICIEKRLPSPKKGGPRGPFPGRPGANSDCKNIVFSQFFAFFEKTNFHTNLNDFWRILLFFLFRVPKWSKIVRKCIFSKKAKNDENTVFLQSEWPQEGL